MSSPADDTAAPLRQYHEIVLSAMDLVDGADGFASVEQYFEAFNARLEAMRVGRGAALRAAYALGLPPVEVGGYLDAAYDSCVRLLYASCWRVGSQDTEGEGTAEESQWFSRLLEPLRALDDVIEATAGVPNCEAAAPSGAATQKPPTTRALVLDLLSRNPEAVHWSQREVARAIGRSPAAVALVWSATVGPLQEAERRERRSP